MISPAAGLGSAPFLHSTPSASMTQVHVQGLAFGNVNHVVVYSGGDPKNLRRILFNPSFPNHAEVITGELSLLGWKDGAGRLLSQTLPGLRHQMIFARKSGNLREVERLEKAYRDSASRAREIYREFALSHEKTGGIPKEILDLSGRKKLTLWVGAPRYEKKNGKLHNAIFCVKDGKVVAHHDKEFLYSVEKDVFDSPPSFNGDFGNEVSLICWETEALNPHFHKPPLLEPLKKSVSVRRLENPFLAFVSAYWPCHEGHGLRGQVSKAVRRAVGSDKRLGFRHEGSLAFVSNDGWEGCVMGPSREPGSASRKSEAYASIRKPGMIHVVSSPDGDISISKYDLSLSQVED